MPNITLTSKYVEDSSGNKFAPITTPNAVRWPNGDDLDDKLAAKQAVIDSSNKLSASNVSGLATVAISGSYNHLSDKPTIPTYSVMGASGSSHASGLTPDTPSTAGTTKFLREDGTWQVPAGDVSGKEDKMSIVNVTSNNTTYSPSINTLSTISMQSNLTVTLPTITTDTDKVQSLVLILTTYQAYTPNLTINGPSGSIVYVDPDFSIEAGKTYEINCMYFCNGNPIWAIASKEIFWGGV